MKVRLLNDGGFHVLRDVEFPVEVEATPCRVGFDVLGSEVNRVGVTDLAPGYPYYFHNDAVEVVLEEAETPSKADVRTKYRYAQLEKL